MENETQELKNKIEDLNYEIKMQTSFVLISSALTVINIALLYFYIFYLR